MTNADWTDDGQNPEQRLTALGLELPAPFPPAASYRPLRVHGDIAYVSGHGPMLGGVPVYRGKLGADVDIEAGQLSAQLTALNVLASVKEELGELGRVTGFLKLLVLVNATPDFEFPHLVADGASDLLFALYGPSSRPPAPRSASPRCRWASPRRSRRSPPSGKHRRPRRAPGGEVTRPMS